MGRQLYYNKIVILEKYVSWYRNKKVESFYKNK